MPLKPATGMNDHRIERASFLEQAPRTTHDDHLVDAAHVIHRRAIEPHHQRVEASDDERGRCANTCKRGCPRKIRSPSA